MLIIFWILAISSGQKVGAYLSDIADAFDRIFQICLLAKLHGFEIDSVYLIFLESYFAPRKVKETLQDASSEAIALEDGVFQDTV